jgi:hypothetical protein
VGRMWKWKGMTSSMKAISRIWDTNLAGFEEPVSVYIFIYTWKEIYVQSYINDIFLMLAIKLITHEEF